MAVELTGTGTNTSVSAVNRLPILALLAASAISSVGNTLTMIALPWIVLETTGSAARTGLHDMAATKGDHARAEVAA